jgi:uncharacterized protein YndB with AHSA1/START domain
MNAPPDIVREVVIAAPPDQVFPYFTDPEKMIVWKAVDHLVPRRRWNAGAFGPQRSTRCDPRR